MCRVEIEVSNPRNDLADRNRGFLLFIFVNLSSHFILRTGSSFEPAHHFHMHN